MVCDIGWPFLFCVSDWMCADDATRLAQPIDRPRTTHRVVVEQSLGFFLAHDAIAIVIFRMCRVCSLAVCL